MPGAILCLEFFPKTQAFGPIFIGGSKFIFSLCHLAYSIQNFSSMFARARVAEASDGNGWTNEIDKRYVRSCKTPAQSE